MTIEVPGKTPGRWRVQLRFPELVFMANGVEAGALVVSATNIQESQHFLNVEVEALFAVSERGGAWRDAEYLTRWHSIPWHNIVGVNYIPEEGQHEQVSEGDLGRPDGTRPVPGTN